MIEPFYFNDISSMVMSVWLDDDIFDKTPDINYQEDNIEGLDGAIYTPLNLKPVVVTKTATLIDLSKMDAVKTWLRGEGVFEYKGKKRKCRIFSGLEMEYHGPFKRKFSVTFIFDPIWYTDEGWKTLPLINASNSSGQIGNSGNYTAKPIILIRATAGPIDLKVNDVRFSLTLDAGQEITIDCEAGTETLPKAIEIGYRYPTLQPGINEITRYAGAFYISFRRKDAWI